MRYFSLVLSVLLVTTGFASGNADDAGAALEQQVTALVSAPQVTVVHFWAPWCSNCKAEMRADGWAKFIADNPSTKVVFINVWHKGQDPAPKLAAAGLGAQANFVGLTHPNASNLEGEKLSRFLGMPVAWVPTTWIYRTGKLRYALNYGEVRFEMLRQMVNDASASW